MNENTSLYKASRIMKHRKYTDEQIDVLRKYYPDSNYDEIFKVFQGYSKKNIKSIAETVNTEEIITRIIPIAFNGHMLAGERPWVDSPYISSYPHIYAKLVKFETYKLRADVTGEPAATDHIYETIEDLRLALRMFLFLGLILKR